MYSVATILEHRDVYDRAARLDELVSLIRDLDATESAILLCQLNADLRLVKRDRDAVAKIQQDIAGGMLSDETIARLKARFGSANMGDRPIFHPVQVLNVLRLTAQYSKGNRSPFSDNSARYLLGDACFMMSDLMATTTERLAIKSRDADNVMNSLMIQLLAPFELLNTADISHVAYRSRIMFKELLKKEEILARIRNQCEGFDFEREFARVTNVGLSQWLSLLLAFHAYLSHCAGGDGTRDRKFLAIDRAYFSQGTPIPEDDMDATLATLSTKLDALEDVVSNNTLADWRFDSVPIRSKPFLELQPGKFYCADLGLLVEKIHSGVYWAIHDGVGSADRIKLSRAWGLLFEEYVNWFLSDREFRDFSFHPSPKWYRGNESFDGAFMKRGVFIPMEYKGAFLRRDAKYSGDSKLFEENLESKIVRGCKQLARKIEKLFNKKSETRNTLRDLPTSHITRVVPVLVVQDAVLAGPLVNWKLNQRFNELLDRSVLRPGVTVDSMTVVGIRELESMTESAEAGVFDLFHGLQLKCYADPEMCQGLHNFLLTLPGYGEGRSVRVRKVIDEQFRDITKYLFGKTAGTQPNQPISALTS
jgi:hypothetical protein